MHELSGCPVCHAPTSGATACSTADRTYDGKTVLAACCVEALANLYLAQKTTSEEFAILKWTRFIEKWTVLPSLFVPNYSFPKDGELYQDLKRLSARRNALVYLKEAVSRDGAALHPGLHPDVASDESVFIGRCQSLPDRLLEHLASFDKTDVIVQIKTVRELVPVLRKMRRRLNMA